MAFGGGPPANRPPHCPPCSPARCASQLSFSIDRILAPDFGRTTARKAVSQPAIHLGTPKRDSDGYDRNSGFPCIKSLSDTRNLVENTPECISPLFGGSSISSEDPTCDTISTGFRNEFHNTSPTNCCNQNVLDHTTRVINSVSVMIPEENQENHKTQPFLPNWMSPNSAAVISQTPELGRSSVDLSISNCSLTHENERLLVEQYRSRSAHEAFQQEISPLTDHTITNSPPNVRCLISKPPGDACTVLTSSDESENAAVCKTRTKSPTAMKSQECSEESSSVRYILSLNSTETPSSAFSKSDHLQTSARRPLSSSLKTKLLKTRAANDSNRLCRSLSPSTLRTIEGNIRSEIPNNSKTLVNADSSQNKNSQNGSQQQEMSTDSEKPVTWPAWVYCTRYSDRPSSGPRSRRKNRLSSQGDEKRSRTAFTGTQLSRLRQEFQENRYLTEQTRLRLAKELRLTESQVKIWFQNKRAKLKKSTGQKNPLALQLMAQGLYKHSVQNDSKEK